MKADTHNQFEDFLANCIRTKIRELRKDGTVGMSMANLSQCIRPPSHLLMGAPRGPVDYKLIFERVAKSVWPKGFELLGGDR